MCTAIANLSEVELSQNILAEAQWNSQARLAVAQGVVEAHVAPLVDGERLVAVHEPRNVTKPLKIDGHRAVVEEETAEQQQRNDQRSR